MAKRKNENGDSSPNEFRFNLTGLIVLCGCLTGGSLFLGAKFLGTRQSARNPITRRLVVSGYHWSLKFTDIGLLVR